MSARTKIDERKMKDLIMDLNNKDENWEWGIAEINENMVKITWGYLEYIGEKQRTFDVKWSENLNEYSAQESDGQFLDIGKNPYNLVEDVYYHARSTY